MKRGWKRGLKALQGSSHGPGGSSINGKISYSLIPLTDFIQEVQVNKHQEPTHTCLRRYIWRDLQMADMITNGTPYTGSVF